MSLQTDNRWFRGWSWSFWIMVILVNQNEHKVIILIAAEVLQASTCGSQDNWLNAVFYLFIWSSCLNLAFYHQHNHNNITKYRNHQATTDLFIFNWLSAAYFCFRVTREVNCSLSFKESLFQEIPRIQISRFKHQNSKIEK